MTPTPTRLEHGWHPLPKQLLRHFPKALQAIHTIRIKHRECAATLPISEVRPKRPSSQQMTSQLRERQRLGYQEVRTITLLDCVVLRTVHKERPIGHHEIRSHRCYHASLPASLHTHDSARNHRPHPPQHEPPAAPHGPASETPQP